MHDFKSLILPGRKTHISKSCISSVFALLSVKHQQTCLCKLYCWCLIVHKLFNLWFQVYLSEFLCVVSGHTRFYRFPTYGSTICFFNIVRWRKKKARSAQHKLISWGSPLSSFLLFFIFYCVCSIKITSGIKICTSVACSEILFSPSCSSVVLKSHWVCVSF